MVEQKGLEWKRKRIVPIFFSKPRLWMSRSKFSYCSFSVLNKYYSIDYNSQHFVFVTVLGFILLLDSYLSSGTVLYESSKYDSETQGNTINDVEMTDGFPTLIKERAPISLQGKSVRIPFWYFIKSHWTQLIIRKIQPVWSNKNEQAQIISFFFFQDSFNYLCHVSIL